MRYRCSLGVVLRVGFWLVLAGAATGQTKLGEFIPADPPQPAPEISLTGADGKTASLADFKGKLVLVNLWATWCQPCLKEMPSLAKLPDKLGDQFALLAVSEDRAGEKIVAPFVEKLGLDKLKIYLDRDSKVGHAFKVQGLPTTIAIGPNGDVLGRVEGGADWESDKMLGTLKKLLPEAGKQLPSTIKASLR
jgi:thiol-disulfide isomerase/thioredoxin